jgi:hypothetical protein
MTTKEVSARLDIEVFVDCPECDFMLDLLNPGDVSGRELNEDGRILSQACGDGCWTDNHESFEIDNITCSHCKATFNVRKIEW